MKLESGKFIVTRPENAGDAVVYEKDGLVLGRMPSCDIVLNHRFVSRVHAGINRLDGEYFLINLSAANSLTLNGRLLASEEADVLADGDVIQIGPFAILAALEKKSLNLEVTYQFTGDAASKTTNKLSAPLSAVKAQTEVQDVLKVFWEKRTRDKDDFGSSLRPAANPLPGKSLINWRPTDDLAQVWRGGIFTWSLLILAAAAFLTFQFYPQAYAPKPLSNPHTRPNLTKAEPIASRPNNNSCVSCHTLDGNIEISCVRCHSADGFHATMTEKHQAAGIACTTCHKEHQGADFEPRNSAFAICTACHNDDNHQLYNGKSVAAPHRGGLGYPAENGVWKWDGITQETAATMPEVTKFTQPDDDAQTVRNKQFHAIHMFRLSPADGMKTDKNGAISCSTCHTRFSPIDRETPKQTCAKCHNGYVDQATGKVLVAADRQNCVSCHVQHQYDKNRWGGTMTETAQKNRANAVNSQIKEMNGEN